MQRYYVPKDQWNKESVILINEDAHHIKRVMRQQIGDTVICNHPDGQAAVCMIEQMTDDHVQVRINTWLDEDSELPVHVTIAQGLPKGSKLELIFQKGTELGATAFQLFEADRSIAKWDPKKAEKRLSRYRKIIKEASEQCHRLVMPVIKEFESLENMVGSDDYDYILFGYEEEAKRQSINSLAKVLTQITDGQRILIIIGPEGGFSQEEVLLLTSKGAIPVRLGKRILRTETASLYALASISYHFEELRCKK